MGKKEREEAQDEGERREDGERARGHLSDAFLPHFETNRAETENLARLLP